MGQSNERGDGGIYIGSIMKGGAVAADGRIEPGDMLLQVSVSTLGGRIVRSPRRLEEDPQPAPPSITQAPLLSHSLPPALFLR